MLAAAAAIALVAWPGLARADVYINTKGISVQSKPYNCSFIRTSTT